MTYIESLKSGHIAVWNPDRYVLTPVELARESEVAFNIGRDKVIELHCQSDIYAVNAINQMIDSARDL